MPGLNDLRNGKTNTVGALLVAIAATRLTKAGLDIPKDRLALEPELTLYTHLQNEQDDAYRAYLGFRADPTALPIAATLVTEFNKLVPAIAKLLGL